MASGKWQLARKEWGLLGKICDVIICKFAGIFWVLYLCRAHKTQRCVFVLSSSPTYVICLSRDIFCLSCEEENLHLSNTNRRIKNKTFFFLRVAVLTFNFPPALFLLLLFKRANSGIHHQNQEVVGAKDGAARWWGSREQMYPRRSMHRLTSSNNKIMLTSSINKIRLRRSWDPTRSTD